MSNLPPIEQIESDYVMKIERLIVNDYPVQPVRTLLDLKSTVFGFRVQNLMVDLYKVWEPRVLGYMPSKVWITDVSDQGIPRLEMSFYVNNTLPAQSRPFGDQPMYVFAIQVEPTETIEYNVETRVFIDHIMYNGKVWYLFCFGQDHYNGIIAQSQPDAN